MAISDLPRTFPLRQVEAPLYLEQRQRDVWVCGGDHAFTRRQKI